MTLQGKTALVTGAGRGIGHAIALKLAGEGALVAVNSHTSQNAEAVAAEIRSCGGQAMALPADVASSDDVKGLFDALLAKCGKLDILVNNAGILRDKLLLHMSDEDWDTVINTDLRSVFLCTRAALKTMLGEHAGRIINISSIAAFAGNPGQTSYAAAKAGIIGFTRSMSREVAKHGITVNAIAPGFIETDMTALLSDKQRAELIMHIPAGFPGAAQDVAEAVAFLASDAARYITGQVITVDGGLATGHCTI
ncbi:MAG: 3-oxoacyl-[acyl-carrier-protein] reductase [Dehalococcoidia bacterium]|nr:3-oxoacyl-[acyl-carrier-protein] reductase [Dehalococcoidia bacterium]